MQIGRHIQRRDYQSAKQKRDTNVGDNTIKISYITGEQYCVLLIPKQKAEQLNIADSNEITIKTTDHGIAIEKEKPAGVSSTSSDKILRLGSTNTKLGEEFYDK